MRQEERVDDIMQSTFCDRQMALHKIRLSTYVTAVYIKRNAKFTEKPTMKTPTQRLLADSARTNKVYFYN
jgi:hypothetical protein